LVDELDQQWSPLELRLFARDHLNVNLENLAPDATMEELAYKLINELNSVSFPPRDTEMLEKFRTYGNARLREIAAELLLPSFYSPTNDPHDAIVLGRAVFVDRAELRQKLREFTNPTPNTTRVLIIRGDEPCGKSYSWPFLRHLAKTSVGVHPLRMGLSEFNDTPRHFVEEIFTLLNLNQAALPPRTDETGTARFRPLINAFKGEIVRMQQRYWLVIDDINDPGVSPLIRDTVYAIAYSVEDTRPDNLWVILLGYNARITDIELRWVAQDNARFPDAALLAEHFQLMSRENPNPLTAQEARAYADLLLAKFPKLTKEAMTELTPLIEHMGEKIRQGERV
jgi:hypothetical protein